MLEISPDQPIRKAREDLERQYFKHHLQASGWKLKDVAAIAGVTLANIYQKCHAFGFYRPKVECAAIKEAPQPWTTDR